MCSGKRSLVFVTLKCEGPGKGTGFGPTKPNVCPVSGGSREAASQRRLCWAHARPESVPEAGRPEDVHVRALWGLETPHRLSESAFLSTHAGSLLAKAGLPGVTRGRW